MIKFLNTKFLNTKTVVTTVTLLIVLVALIVLDELEKMDVSRNTPSQPPLPIISAVEILPTNQAASIKVLAKIKARYESQMTSQVDGQVVFLSENLLAGSRVKKGELLVAIEDSANVAELANAYSQLSQAKIALLTEERQAAQARRDWQRSSLEQQPNSPLVLREPQLQAAKLQLKAAKANVARAEALLSYTKIKAPFRGVVVQRDVSPGELLAVGQPVAQIMATDVFDVVAQVDHKQWSLLTDNWQSQSAYVVDLQSQQRWQATIRSGGHFFDSKTQLRNIYLSINVPDDSKQSLLPGKLMQVILPGKILNNVIVAPESTFTRDSHVWLVNKDDRLEKRRVELLASESNKFTLSLLGLQQDSYRIAVFPQSSFTIGQKVKPTDFSWNDNEKKATTRRMQRVSQKVMSEVKTRHKLAKKRSLYSINEHFEPIFNDVFASAVVLRPLLQVGAR